MHSDTWESCQLLFIERGLIILAFFSLNFLFLLSLLLNLFLLFHLNILTWLLLLLNLFFFHWFWVLLHLFFIFIIKCDLEFSLHSPFCFEQDRVLFWVCFLSLVSEADIHNMHRFTVLVRLQTTWKMLYLTSLYFLFLLDGFSSFYWFSGKGFSSFVG